MMNVDFIETAQEEVRRAHARLKAEHAALAEIFDQDAEVPSDRAARQTFLGELRLHLARLQSHRITLRAIQ